MDLGAQEITLHGPDDIVFRFDIDAASKERLIKGLDGIDISLAHEADIARFEKTHEPFIGP